MQICIFGVFEILVCKKYQQKSQDHEMQVPISKYTALQICVFHSPCTHGFKPEFSPETAKTTYVYPLVSICAFKSLFYFV